MKYLATKGLILLFICLSASAHAADEIPSSGAGTPAASSSAVSQEMSITRNGSQPSLKGASQKFTGSVRLDPLFDAKSPARTSAIYVTFEPGARTAWHTHPLGQMLVVTAGVGRVQQWGGPIEEIQPGDVVRIPPGVKHWHGASPSKGMTHIAIHEQLSGEHVEWMEKVSDAEYGKRP